jgi:hypothetical protein
MKKRILFYLIVAGVIVLFDLVASVISRRLEFDYTKLAWVSWGLYFAAGYFGCRYFDLISGVVAGLVAGLSDSTLGWAVSSAVGAYIPFTQPEYSPLLVLIVIIIISVKSTFLGLLGALLGTAIKRRGRALA